MIRDNTSVGGVPTYPLPPGRGRRQTTPPSTLRAAIFHIVVDAKYRGIVLVGLLDDIFGTSKDWSNEIASASSERFVDPGV